MKMMKMTKILFFHDTIQGEVGDEFDGEVNDNDDDVHGDPINNEFLYPVDQHKGATGMMFEQDGVAYIQYCFCGNPYYTLYVIYGDDHGKN